MDNDRQLEITPKLGIGDLIFWKMYEISCKDTTVKRINIKQSIVKTYRINSNNYIDFLKQFLYKIFPSSYIKFSELTYSTNLPVQSIKKLYIYDDCNFIKHPVSYSDYIVIHTKCRFDDASTDFLNSKLGKIREFLMNKSFKYKIMLLGERDQIEQNIETKTHNIQSIYSILIECLRENNEIIDLTRDGLYSDNTIASFEEDLCKINNAKLNITFGYGGPLTLSVAFSKNTVGFIGNLTHPVLQKYSEFSEVSLHSNVNTFFTKLEEYT